MLTREGLTSAGVDGRALRGLAERWTWENNNRALRVHLRPGIILHDGRPLTSGLAAEAVRFTITQPRNRMRFPALVDIASVEPDGELELLLNLSRPSALLPEDLTVSLELEGDETGAGPYKLVRAGESEIVLERFEHYYLGTPSIQRIVVRNFDALRTAWASLLRHEVDMVSTLPADAVEFILNDDVQVVTHKRWYQFAIALNSNRPVLRSQAVRKAINLAVDREELIRVALHGKGSPAIDPIWPLYWAADAARPDYSFDPDRARDLLDGAGYRILRSPPGMDARPARLRFTCLVVKNFSVQERIALVVQKHLFNVGIDMQVRVVEPGDLDDLIDGGDFDALLLDMISGPTPGRAYHFWASAQSFQGRNTFGYENPDAEQAFNIIRTSFNEAAVRSATARLQRIMADDPPAIFLAWNEGARAIRRGVSLPDTPDRDPMWSVARWTAAGPASTSKR